MVIAGTLQIAVLTAAIILLPIGFCLLVELLNLSFSPVEEEEEIIPAMCGRRLKTAERRVPMEGARLKEFIENSIFWKTFSRKLEELLSAEVTGMLVADAIEEKRYGLEAVATKGGCV